MASHPLFHSPRVFLALALLISPFGLRAADKLTQPIAPVKPVTDTYFNTPVVDNYRWMEDLKSPEVQTWMKGQAAYTKDFLSKLPGRDELVKRVMSLDNASTRVVDLTLCGTRYFYEKLTPKDQTPKLYARDGLKGEERLLVDAQVLAASKDRYSISGFSPSPDGKYVAVEIAPGGSEEGVVRVLNAATGKPLKDSIDRIWGASVCWDQSDKFFYYRRLQELGPGKTAMDKELDSTSYLHQIGDDPKKDVAVLGRVAFPALNLAPTDESFISVDPGATWALGIVAHGVKNELSVFISPADALAKGAPTWTRIVDVDDQVTSVASFGHELWLQSHKDAPRFKVLHIDMDHPDLTKADVAIPQSDLVIKNLGTAKDALYVESTRGGISQISRLPYGTADAKPLPLPFEGSVQALSTNVQNDGALMRLAGWTHPPQWYAYDPAAQPGRFLGHHVGGSHRARGRRHADSPVDHLQEGPEDGRLESVPDGGLRLVRDQHRSLF